MIKLNVMKKKRFLPILALIVVLFIAAVGYLYYKILTDKSTFTVVSKIFSDHLDPNVQVSYEANGKLYWPVLNNAFATVNPSQELQIKSLCDDGFSQEEYSLFDKKMDTTLMYLDNYFLVNNFKKVSSPVYSTKPFSQNSYGLGNAGIIIAYQHEKQDLLCVIVFSGACSTGKITIKKGDLISTKTSLFRTGTVSCNSITNAQQTVEKQLDYLLAFGGPGLAVNIDDTYGNYYNFTLQDPLGGGWQIIAQKTSFGWKRITQNGLRLSCNQANLYKVPHQLKGAEQCFDSITQKEVNNPN